MPELDNPVAAPLFSQGRLWGWLQVRSWSRAVSVAAISQQKLARRQVLVAGRHAENLWWVTRNTIQKGE